jgi:enterochelin esterase family protein
MGGTQAFFIGLNHPGSFGWVGSMSGAFMMYAGDFDAWLGHATSTPASELPDVWLSTGTDDFVLGPNRQVVEWLKRNSLPVEYRETTGAHTWGVWRRALAEFAPRLFRRH